MRINPGHSFEDDEEDEIPDAGVQSSATAGAAHRQQRRRASVEAEQAALMVRFPSDWLPSARAAEGLTLCCGRSSQAAAAAAAADGGGEAKKKKKKKKKSKDADYLVPVGRSVRTAALHLLRARPPALPCCESCRTCARCAAVT